MKNFIKDTKRFFEPALVDKWLFIRGIFTYSLMWGYPYFNVLIIKKITQKLEVGDYNGFENIFYIFVVFVIIYTIINYFSRHWGWAEMFHSLMKYIHRIYMPRFIELDNNKVENIGTGKMISIINSGIGNWVGGIIDTLRSVSQIIIAFAFALYIFKDAGYTYLLIFLLTIIIFTIFSFKLNSISLEKRRNRANIEILYNNQLVRMIMSKFEIYQNNKIQKEIDILDNYTDDARKLNLELNGYLYYMFVGPKVILTIFRIAIYFIIGYGVFNHTHKISEVVGIIGLLGVMEETSYSFLNYFKGFTQQFVNIRKLWDTFDEIPPIQEKKGLKNFEFKAGNVEIKDLSFSYDNSGEVFNNFNLSIKGGKKTAFVGNSGSGKTTLIKLIIGFIKSEKGKILIDNQDISKINLQSYYENIGYLTQEPSVFDGTIIDNLTYGAKHDITENELKEAIKLAGCEFIYEFEKGLETEIGEKGIRLSGGQRQRLAIAKIFIKNPKIIVLDEPTSALDSFSEEKISEAFHNLFSGRTVIIIAHRLQTVKEADDIIVFEKGIISERGTHNSLVKIDGIYSKMLKLQAGF